MKLIDKIMLGTAGLSAYGIAMLVFSGELKSEYYKETPSVPVAEISRNIAISPESPNHSEYDKSSLLIYDKEVDEIIQAYYKNIKKNPEKWEEENRLIRENPEENDLHAKANHKETTSSEGFKFLTYTVDHGDSLWRISQKFNVPVHTIVSANPAKDREIIRPGESLNIPNKAGIVYTVKSGDSISKIAKKYKISPEKIMENNNVDAARLIAGQKIFLTDAKPAEEVKIISRNRFIWPIAGKVTSGFGMRRHPLNNTQHFHAGLDIGARTGERIKAAADGVVVFSGDGGSYGNMIVLRHKDGYMSVYAHASSLNAVKGQFVKQGDIIARVGSTGVTTGPHLHFEVKKSSAGLNPLTALKEKIKIKIPDNG